jgi:hypothetical protein
MVQVVESLPSKLKALSSKPNIAKKKKEQDSIGNKQENK